METSHERQYNLDLLKAVAIICMVICHFVWMLGSYRPNYQNEFLYFFADVFLGGYFVVAHGFMFSMGLGIVYSRRNSPIELIDRGLKIILIAYLLNFLRSGMFFLTYDLINGAITKDSLVALFESDILQFVGLALIFTGILRKFKLKGNYIFAIGLILSAIGTTIAFNDMGNYMLNTLLGLFVFSTHDATTFTFSNWYLFVATGILFGEILHSTHDKDRLYKWVLIISGIYMALYIILTGKFSIMALSPGHMYYACSPIEAFGLLSIDFFLLSVFYFLLKKIDISNFHVLVEMSMNINSIYCIHWCIIGAIEFFGCFLLGWQPSYTVLYIGGVILIIVSFFLARWYKSQKAKYMERQILC